MTPEQLTTQLAAETRLTNDQLAAMKERAEAATPGPLAFGARRNHCGFEGAGYPVWSEAVLDDLSNVPHTQAGFSALGDTRFYCHAREDVRALIAEVERGTEEAARMARQVDDLAGRLGEAALVILAVKDWDEAGGDRPPEASRLLHNAYVDWHNALKRMDQALKPDSLKPDSLTRKEAP